MLKKFVAAALTLALAATGAAAYVAPGGKIGASGDMIVKVVDPPVKKKSVTVQRNVTVQKKVMVTKKTSTPTVKKATVNTKKPVVSKAPVVSKMPVAKKPLVKDPVLAKGKPVSKMPVQFVHIKQHRRHKWYGRTIGGVVLGSLLAASIYYTYSAPPADGLCWYWTNSDRERGYWDYCTPPDDDE